MKPVGSTRDPSDAIWTIPNALTFARLGFTPVFVWVALGPERLDIAMVMAFAGLVSDLVDGKIARATGQVSRLGIKLDPLVDRLAIIAGAIVLLVHEALAPAWIVLVIVGRDLLLLVIGVPVLRARGIPIPPVSRIGKFGSFWTSIAVALFLSSGWFDVRDPIVGVQVAAWIVCVVAVPAYWAAGLGYARAAFAR